MIARVVLGRGKRRVAVELPTDAVGRQRAAGDLKLFFGL